MTNEIKKPEILAPAGTWESVAAALNGGCDAIYIGGRSFNARQYADNPSNEELKDIIEKCHLCGARVFVTLNILLKQDEINAALDFVSQIYSYGADGIIIQDIGIFTLIKRYFPNIMLSASTQMTIHNKSGVDLAKQMGFDRVVLSRELSLEEIRNITATEGIQIEAFVHGALCVCYSGRCLMSSIIGQRSGNRGRCAQPCRMDYSLLKCRGKDRLQIKSGCLLSPKDISTAEIIDRLVDCKIDSLKIEGRMKSAEYVYCVTSFYRKYIDMVCKNGEYKPTAEDLRDLTQIFNRGGSSHTGYYQTYAGTDMMSKSPKSSGVQIGTVADYDKKQGICTIALTSAVTGGDGIEIWTKGPHTGTNISQKAEAGEKIRLRVSGSIQKGDKVFRSFDKRLADRLKNGCTAIKRQISVDVAFRAYPDEEIQLTLPRYGITLNGGKAQQAQNQPMTADAIAKRLQKTGGTYFDFNVKSIDIGENIYIPVSELNDIRRLACERLSEHITAMHTRQAVHTQIEEYLPQKAESTVLSVLVSTYDQFESALKARPHRIYVCCDSPQDADKAAREAHERGIELFAAMPYITRDCNMDLEEYFDQMDKTQIDGYLIRSYIKVNTKKRIAADYTLNVMNSFSLQALKQAWQAETAVLSTELNINELSSLAGRDTEVFAYGRLPLMMTQQCPVGLYCGGKRGGKYCSQRGSGDSYVLKDRKNAEFPIKTECKDCFAVIYNSAPVCLVNKGSDLKALGTFMLRLEFTDEDGSTTQNVIQAYKAALRGEKPLLGGIEKSTKGHFYRGVE